MTQMSKDQLIKKWIQFLKSNRLVAMQSDPDTGKLNYLKPITTNELTRFLKITTDFTDDEINNAIKTALTHSKGVPPKIQNTQKQQPNKQEPAKIQGPEQIAQPTQPKKKYDTDNATDIDFKEINEAILDTAGNSLSEDDIENIFTMLSSIKKMSSDEESSMNTDADATEKIEKIKNLIDNVMTDGQRKSLWRALNA